MRIPVTSPLRDPHHPLSTSMLAGVGGGNWSTLTPLPPPPGFRPLPNPPIFWSPQPPPPFYSPTLPPPAGPQQLASHYFYPAPPTTAHWEMPSPETPLAPVVGQKRRRERLPGTGRRQNKALRRSSKRSPTSVSTPKSSCVGDSEISSSAPLMVKLKKIQTRIAKRKARQETPALEATMALTRENCLKDVHEGQKRKSVSTLKAPSACDSTASSSNVPLKVLETKLSLIKRANRKTLENTACVNDSEMSSKAPLNMLISKMIQKRKAKRQSLKDIFTTCLPLDVHEEDIQAEASVNQLRAEGPNGKSVSTLKAPCACDSSVSSSDVPLIVLKTKLSQIKSANNLSLEKTTCMGDSEVSSNAPLIMFKLKKMKTRKAQLGTSALKATAAIARENPLKHTPTTNLPQNDHEEEVPSGGNRVDGPTETDEMVVTEILQHNPQVSETVFMGAMNKMTHESDKEVERREKRSPSHCQSTTTTCLLNRVSELEEDASNLASSLEVGQYSVHPSVSPILKAIFNKYGDIAKYSICESKCSVLESICKVIQGIEVPAKHLKPLDFKNYYLTVKNADELGMNVKWLLERLDKHLAAVRLVVRCEDMRDAMKKNMELRDSIKKSAELKKVEVKELKQEIQEAENQLSSEVSEIKKLKNDMNASADKSKFFRDEGLMGGDCCRFSSLAPFLDPCVEALTLVY